MSNHEKVCPCIGGELIRIGASIFIYVQRVQGNEALLFVQSHNYEKIEFLTAYKVEALEKALKTVGRQRREGDLIWPPE